MNKTDLVNAIADEARITKTDAANALKAAINAITEALASGEKVSVVGFGTFSIAEKAARSGVNPAQKK